MDNAPDTSYKIYILGASFVLAYFYGILSKKGKNRQSVREKLKMRNILKKGYESATYEHNITTACYDTRVM